MCDGNPCPIDCQYVLICHPDISEQIYWEGDDEQDADFNI